MSHKTGSFTLSVLSSLRRCIKPSPISFQIDTMEAATVRLLSGSDNDPWSSNWKPRVQREVIQTKTRHPDTGSSQLTIRPEDKSRLLEVAANSTSSHNDVLIDWSRVGPTSARHVDLGRRELPPGFVTIAPLGRSNSTVYELSLIHISEPTRR